MIKSQPWREFVDENFSFKNGSQSTSDAVSIVIDNILKNPEWLAGVEQGAGWEFVPLPKYVVRKAVGFLAGGCHLKAKTAKGKSFIIAHQKTVDDYRSANGCDDLSNRVLRAIVGY